MVLEECGVPEPCLLWHACRAYSSSGWPPAVARRQSVCPSVPLPVSVSTSFPSHLPLLPLPSLSPVHSYHLPDPPSHHRTSSSSSPPSSHFPLPPLRSSARSRPQGLVKLGIKKKKVRPTGRPRFPLSVPVSSLFLSPSVTLFSLPLPLLVFINKLSFSCMSIILMTNINIQLTSWESPHKIKYIMYTFCIRHNT